MKKKSLKLRTCGRCGWVAFAVSEKFAKAEVKKFNKYFDSLPREQQISDYGGKDSSIKQYERCFSCGTCYHNFRPSKKNGVPIGCTLQPIIWDKK